MSAQPDTDLYRRPYRFTVDEYEQLGRSGYFDGYEGRVELLDGQIVSQPGPGPTHASVVNRLNRLFMQRLGHRAIVSVQNPSAWLLTRSRSRILPCSSHATTSTPGATPDPTTSSW